MPIASVNTHFELQPVSLGYLSSAVNPNWKDKELEQQFRELLAAGEGGIPGPCAGAGARLGCRQGRALGSCRAGSAARDSRQQQPERQEGALPGGQDHARPGR